ncbi:MAG: large extracellular alpha-helical protein, partial [Thermodesulfobacteriota bacterium]
ILSEQVDSYYSRILATPLRSNCASLSALLKYGETPGGGETVADIPFKLVRSITQSRERSDRWENTQENLFCMNSIVDFSRLYEKETPEMIVGVSLDKELMGSVSFSDLRDASVDIERPIKEGDPGRKATLQIERTGKGRLYYSTRLFYAPKEFKTTAINSGIEVRREYSVERDGKWELLGDSMELNSGDLVKIDIFLSLPTARNFVVVDDPVPGGLEPVNRDLATASIVDADKGVFKGCDCSFWYTRDDWIEYGYSRWSFYHKELRHHSARFYSEYLPAGNYHLSYMAQAIAPGSFSVMPLHTEEMYDPDVYGKGRPATLKIERAE